ncbi:MAG: hypothetical protein GZ085_13545 [Sulfuriferula multivorans]|uniref:Uncharacterized protein n=1 Tax=Sulfuriferula multivorans TaxID=1559896 RepID=A0A7C9TAT4_9PROT|nr:hypothetical protein [Sulfuriferula multivorans]
MLVPTVETTRPALVGKAAMLSMTRQQAYEISIHARLNPAGIGKTAPAWQPVGLKGNRLQIRLSGSYFATFLVNRTTIDLQKRQNLPSPSRIFATIF